MTTRRKYDDKFKEDAVNLLISSGKGVCEAARDLGIPESCMGRWYQAHLKKLDGNAGCVSDTERLPSDIEKENRQLRKELAEMTQQREILKKAIGIFSRTPDKPAGRVSGIVIRHLVIVVLFLCAGRASLFTVWRSLFL